MLASLLFNHFFFVFLFFLFFFFFFSFLHPPRPDDEVKAENGLRVLLIACEFGQLHKKKGGPRPGSCTRRSCACRARGIHGR